MTTFLASEEAIHMIDGLTKVIEPILIEGRTYHAEVFKNEHGSSGGSLYFYENGKLHNFADYGDYDEDEIEAHLDEIDDAEFEGNDFKNLLQFFPVHAKIKFTLQKGHPIQAVQHDVEQLLQDIKATITERIEPDDDKGHFIRTEALIRFQLEADELGMFIEQSEQYEKNISSFDILWDNKNLHSLYYFLDEKLDAIYFKVENDTLSVQSAPALPEFNFAPLTTTEISLDNDFKKRKEAGVEAIKARHDFYQSLGELEERILYLRVGGFRDYPWPEDSTSHNSCKMRVIHAPQSTILITDGLTDVYSTASQDPNLQYNGIGAEFYMEFHGHISYEIIHKHFAMALVNSVSQVAIAHGDFQKYMLHHVKTSLEFTEENVEVWINRENHANHNMASFLTDTFIKNDSFSVALGLDSQTVPQKVKLNIEEVLMINIKPIAKKWLTNAKLKSNDDAKAKKAMTTLVDEFKASGEWNLVPLTYQETYVEGEPNSDGVVTAPLFPF